MPKSLFLVVNYVNDAAAVERDYVAHLALRPMVRHEFITDLSRSSCIVLGGAEQPPWVALVSGRGPESIAEHVLGERPVGPRHLVFFTDEFETDAAWLRQRGYGVERVITLDGVRVLRRATATIPELAQVIDLVEQPSGDADLTMWLRPIVEAINAPLRIETTVGKSSSSTRPQERPSASLPSLVLPSDEPFERWIERVERHAWSSSCRAIEGGKLERRLGELLRRIGRAGVEAWREGRRAAREGLRRNGVGTVDFTTSGGALPLLDSPVFVPVAEARRMLDASAQRGASLKALLTESYADRPTPIPAEVWQSNPFSYVQQDWAPPTPSGLVQLITDFVCDARSGAFVPIEDNSDSGRCGLATLEPVRQYFDDWYPELSTELGAWPTRGVSATMRDQVAAEFSRRPAPFVVMAYRRDPPPYDLPDWEDVLLARQMNLPLVAESLLTMDGSGLYYVEDGKRRAIDILLHRRPATHYQFHDWMRLVRAGKLKIIDPINSALCNDRGLRAYSDALVAHYRSEAPVISSPRTVMLADPASFDAVRAEPHAWVYKERGGASGRRVVCGSDVEPDAMAPFLRSISDVASRWIAQREVPVASTLFIEPDDEGVRVWEGRYSLHVYTLVGEAVRPLPVLSARVSPALGQRVPGPAGLLAADVWICER